MSNSFLFYCVCLYLIVINVLLLLCRLVFIAHKLWWEKTTVANVEYEEDEDVAGPAKFYYVENWGFSSIGCFWDVDTTSNDYLATNESILTMDNSQIYASVQLSPLSITYYARCLVNGNYTVKLHFAEIVFTSNRSSYSLGKRIFNVYIQVLSHLFFFLGYRRGFNSFNLLQENWH